MGWTLLYNCPDKKQVIEECIRSFGSSKCIRHSCSDNELWTLWYNSNTNVKHIILFLLAKQDGSWGYKPLTEPEGPVYFKCPLVYLHEAPVLNDNWRQKVYEYHNLKRANRRAIRELAIGKIVKLSDAQPDTFRVISMDPLLGNCLKTGVTYKLIKNRIVRVLEVIEDKSNKEKSA